LNSRFGIRFYLFGGVGVAEIVLLKSALVSSFSLINN
jgi:hypothetical protein